MQQFTLFLKEGGLPPKTFWHFFPPFSDFFLPKSLLDQNFKMEAEKKGTEWAVTCVFVGGFFELVATGLGHLITDALFSGLATPSFF